MVRAWRVAVLLAALLSLHQPPGAAAEVATRPEAPAQHRRILFGIQTPQQNTTYEEVLAVWREAEALGFDSAWVYDHLAPIFGSIDKPCLEGWTLLAALAGQTSKLRVGVLVTGNTYRNPALVAKMAVTVDRISHGRLILGIGAAWFGREHEAYGFHFGTARERAERLSESLEVITRLFAGGHPSFSGRYYRLVDAPFSPEPVQRPHPPIVIGGQGKHWIVPLAARYAQGWNAVTGVTPEGVRERIAIIRDECRRIGRDPCDVEISAMLPLISITSIPLAGPVIHLGARLMRGKGVAAGVLAGSGAQVRDQIRKYVGAGVTHVIVTLLPPFDHDLLRKFATEVMPAFR